MDLEDFFRGMLLGCVLGMIFGEGELLLLVNIGFWIGIGVGLLVVFLLVGVGVFDGRVGDLVFVGGGDVGGFGGIVMVFVILV